MPREEIKITVDGSPIQNAAVKKLAKSIEKISPAHRALLCELAENAKAMQMILDNKAMLLGMVH